jgi:HEAT repeat protein
VVRTAALEALRKNGRPNEKRASAVAGIAKRSEEPELRLSALKLLGDYGAAQAVSVARLLLEVEPSRDMLMQSAYALSRVKSEEALSMLINIAAREEMRDFAMGILTDAEPALLEQVVQRRIKTEKDQQIQSVLQLLQSEVSLQ